MKRKIAVIGLKGLPAYGGAATVGENLVNQLKHDFDFTVYSVSSHTNLKTGLYSGFKHVVFKASPIRKINTFIYFVKSVFHVLFLSKYDLIHLHHSTSGFLLPFLAIKYKVIVTFHGIKRIDSSDPKFGKLSNFLLKFSQRLNLLLANKIISVSLVDSAYLKEKYNKDVIYIPNGVEIPNEKGITMVDNNEKYIVFAAGRIYDVKGLHLLLEAMHINNDQRKLLVIGDLGHSSNYGDKIIKLAEGLNVSFVGLIKTKDKLFDLIKSSEIFIFPSLTEAMSMMLLEVASLGIPVIASDIDANKAIFTESEMLFFRSEDSLSLAERMMYAYNNNNLMKGRASKALETVKVKHNWENIGKSYRSVFQEYLNGV